jgi:imidazolonepropionase-like amidohydrolase
MTGLYVSSHTDTSRSIQRAVRNGVRSIEHGNLADEDTLQLIRQHDAFLVRTLPETSSLCSEPSEAREQ